jgi:hypothetical protein
MESLAEQPEYPEHRYLDDFLGGDPPPGVPGARVTCLTSAYIYGAFRGLSSHP